MSGGDLRAFKHGENPRDLEWTGITLSRKEADESAQRTSAIIGFVADLRKVGFSAQLVNESVRYIAPDRQVSPTLTPLFHPPKL